MEKADKHLAGCPSLLHGVLAVENPMLLEHCAHGRLLHNWWHHWRPNALGCKWRKYVYCGRHYCRVSRQLGSCCLRHGSLPPLWKVGIFLHFLTCEYWLVTRYAWIPQVLVLFILIVSAGPYFNASLQSIGDTRTISANRLSFFSLCLYVPNSWAAAASDYYVYYPEKSSKFKTFLLTLTGLWTSFILVYMLGIGLGSGIATNPAWAEANSISTGALVVAGYGGLSGFGKFCSVVIALAVIANSIPGTYSAALGCQVLGRYGKIVPR